MTAIELGILDWIQTLHTPFLDAFMSAFTKLGDAGIIWILLTLVLLLFPKTRKTGLVLMAALLVDVVLCNGILKNLVARTRPFDVNTAVSLLVAKPRDFSFPSGHTAASFASIAALYLVNRDGTRLGAPVRLTNILWKVALVVGCLLAFSRLYLYVHFPTDILGGILVGILSGYLGYQICIRLESRRMDKNGK